MTPRMPTISVLLLLSFTVTVPAQTTPETEEEKLSYTIGVQVGRNLLNQPLVLDRDSLIQGISDALDGADLQLTDEQMRAALTAYQESELEKQQEAAKANKQASSDFLEANRGKEGVQTHPSGLQYRILREGDGERPAADDNVTVHYEGRLIDGTVFDSSYQRGKPVTLQLDRVIEGWKIALPMMPVGSKWQLFIPPELGYGRKGAGPDIGPNSALVFDVELMAVE